MAGSDEANSHPAEGNTRINITGAELQALITAAVSQAVDAKFKEPSVFGLKIIQEPILNLILIRKVSLSTHLTKVVNPRGK